MWYPGVTVYTITLANGFYGTHGMWFMVIQASISSLSF